MDIKIELFSGTSSGQGRSGFFLDNYFLDCGNPRSGSEPSSFCSKTCSEMDPKRARFYIILERARTQRISSVGQGRNPDRVVSVGFPDKNRDHFGIPFRAGSEQGFYRIIIFSERGSAILFGGCSAPCSVPARNWTQNRSDSGLFSGQFPKSSSGGLEYVPHVGWGVV